MPGRGEISGGPGTDNPTRITYQWATMSSILVGAFGLGGDRLLGVPGWADVDRFDLRAITSTGSTKEQVQEMMQNLLKERFHLAFHHIQKELLSCDLVVAKGGQSLSKSGLKLKEAASADGVLRPRGRGAPAILDRDGFPILPPGYTDGQAVTRNGATRWTYRMASIDIVRALLMFARLGCTEIVDKTGLTGQYDFHLEYASRFAASHPTDQTGTPSDPAPDIATAVEQQLGLRLVKSSVKLDAVVVDHLDRTPTEN